MKDIILYHGSRGGINGDIKPCSRIKCDFGKGFYMGENPMQVKGLVVEDMEPIFYTLKFKLSEIPENRILILNNTDWLNTVLAYRKKVPEFSSLDIAKNAVQNLQKYDVVIGPIGDDKMNEAMQAYADGYLTDKGLLACLQYVNFGNQIVALTEFACNKIEILSKREIMGKEADEVRDYSRQKRIESRDIVNSMIRKYRGNGVYLDQLIEKEKDSKNIPFENKKVQNFPNIIIKTEGDLENDSR